MLELVNLKVGDILLLKENTRNLYRHILVITEIDDLTNMCKVAHWVGKSEPYALTETLLPPQEYMNEKNIEFEVFRIRDNEKANALVCLLKQWCNWAIPFDLQRLGATQKEACHSFGITTNILSDRNISVGVEAHAKLNSRVEILRKRFHERYMDIVKYTSRREMGLVRPKLKEGGVSFSETPDAQERGFHCTQGILIALQTVYTQGSIPSIRSYWHSNKKNVENKNLAPDCPTFESTRSILPAQFNINAFLDQIPPAFQIHAKTSCANVLRHTLLMDVKNINLIGVFRSLPRKQIVKFREETKKNMITQYNLGLQNRREVLERIIVTNSHKKNPKTNIF